MKNHFFFGYRGNKRNEVEKILNEIELNNVKTIVEPFCGTFALSYYISTLYPKKYNYVINDNNDMVVELIRIAKKQRKFKKLENEINELIIDIDRDKYNKIIKNSDKDLASYIIKHKIYCIRPGLFPLNYKHKTISICDVPVINFLRNENVKVTNINGTDCYNKYKTKNDALIFLDPPYLHSFNDWYVDPSINIYEYLSENDILNEKAKIILCLEKNWIINILFKGKNIIEYDKKYETNKRKTKHIIITN
jgi:hypothetical protein